MAHTFVHKLISFREEKLFMKCQEITYCTVSNPPPALCISCLRNLNFHTGSAQDQNFKQMQCRAARLLHLHHSPIVKHSFDLILRNLSIHLRLVIITIYYSRCKNPHSVVHFYKKKTLARLVSLSWIDERTIIIFRVERKKIQESLL